jgi:type IV pilus assembly protein PilB
MADFTTQLFEFVQSLETVDAKRLQEAVEESKKTQIPLQEILVQHDLVPDEALGVVVADLYNLPFARLSQTSIPQNILLLIPELVAKKNKIVAFNEDKYGVHVATSQPENTNLISLLEKKTGTPIKLYYATTLDITNALGLYAQDFTKKFSELLNKYQSLESDPKQDEDSIIQITDEIILYGQNNRASDIHIEPEDNATVIRFRLDGILHDITTIPQSLHDRIVTRIKVMASLRTDEHQAAQDGKIVIKRDGEELDIRVSIVPVVTGEKIVLRLLSEASRQFSLHDLGFSEYSLNTVTSAIKKPHGMILATGPTGSGKTTTLYAMLKLLNTRDVNIMTIEDPVEYDISGINQIQVNPKTNLTFAAGLRSIVRQDPNIILVGEIRDEETAGIAINSAMTGHLVLSTLHTNDAATALPRLLDMGVEPFLIASTVNIIIAQRLVRKICFKCRASYELPLDSKQLSEQKDLQRLLKTYVKEKTIRLYKGNGCPVCHNSGYNGRVGIFEILIVDNDLKNAITKRSDATTVKTLAVKRGMKIMLEDGIEKATQGITTIDEIIRVTTE